MVNQTTLTSYPTTLAFANGESVTLEAVPNPGYEFVSWNGSLSGMDNPTATVINCNKNVIANFSPIIYTLTMEVNGSGSTTPEAGEHNYPAGTTVTVKATPDNGWQFDGWTGDVAEPESANIMLTIDSDKTVAASFSKIMQSLTMEVNGNGSTTPEAGKHTYPAGTVITVTATPDSGWQFDGWTGDVAEPESADTVLTIDSDRTVAASFSQVKPNWWLIGGIITGVIIAVTTAWFFIKHRTV